MLNPTLPNLVAIDGVVVEVWTFLQIRLLHPKWEISVTAYVRLFPLLLLFF